METKRFGPAVPSAGTGGATYTTSLPPSYRSVSGHSEPDPITDLDERDSSDSVITGRSPIQPLMAALAERFVKIDPLHIDNGVTSALRNLAEALEMDWGILWRKAAGESDVLPSHCWMRERPQPGADPRELGSTPLVVSALEAEAATWFTRNGDLHGRIASEAIPDDRIRSAAIVPVFFPDAKGALGFGSATAHQHWPPTVLEQLRIVAAILAQALGRRDDFIALQHARDERSQSMELTDAEESRPRSSVRSFGAPNLRARSGVDSLRPDSRDHPGTGMIVGQAPAIRRVLEQAQQVAVTDATVLLLGETGTGKELVATHIHELSARRGRTMVRVNCSAIPSTLIESELFGREKGAFTGALARQIGRFESADHSTIFLDEIGDLPPDVQVKLLRVLEERQIERLGSPRSVPVNVRIITATHRDLEKRIAEDAFREDLFYRLNVFPIRVPALRERPEDIPLLVWRFVIEFSKSFGKRVDAIPRENIEALQRYQWPGNIRELRNVVERAMIVVSGPRLTIALPTSSASTGIVHVRLEDVEREHIREILETVRWRIRGTGGAADQLGLRPTTLETRMAKLGLTRPKTA